MRTYQTALLLLLSGAAWALPDSPDGPPADHMAGAAQAAPASAPSSECATLPLKELPVAEAPPTRPAKRLAEAPELRKAYENALDLSEEGQCAKAIDVLDRSINTAGGDYFELYYAMALAKFRCQRYGDARASAEYAWLFRAQDVDLHVLLGRIYRMQKQWESAIRHFHAAIRAPEEQLDNPRSTSALFELGLCLEERGCLAAAVEVFTRFDDKLAETHPEHRDDPEVALIVKRHPLGLLERRLDLLRRLGRLDELLDAARTAAERKPAEPLFARLYVRALLDANRAAEAFEHCRARLPRDPRAAQRSPYMSLLVKSAAAAAKLTEMVDEILNVEAGDDGTDFLIALALRLEAAEKAPEAVRVWDAARERRPMSGRAAWATATLAMLSGAPERAVTTLAEFVRANPASQHVPVERLRTWFSAGRDASEFERGRAVLLQVGAEPDFAAELALALLASACRNEAQAAARFTAAAQKSSESVLPRAVWSLVESHRYRWGAAREAIAPVLEHTPRPPAAALALATALDGLDETEAAEAAYLDAAKDRDSGIDVVLALARFYRRTGNMLAAQRYFQQALTDDPSNGVALEDLVDSYRNSGKLDIAREQLRLAEEHDAPEDALRRTQTVLRFATQYYRPDHLRELRAQWAGHPDDAITGLRLASGLYVVAEYGEARDVLAQVLKLRPEDDEALFAAASVHARVLEFDAAIAIMARLAQRYPNRPSLALALIELELADFRLDEARARVRGMLEADKKEGPLVEQLRYLLFLSYHQYRDFDGALRYLDEWQSAGAPEGGLLRSRVLTLVDAERHDEALQLIEAREQALRAANPKSPEYAEALALLAVAALDAQQPQRAEPVLREHCEKNPDDFNTAERLHELLVRQKRGSDALELLSKLRPGPQGQELLTLYRMRAEARAINDLSLAIQELDELLAEGFVRNNPLSTFEVRNWITRILMQYRGFAAAKKRCDAWLAALPPGDDSSRLELLDMKRSILRFSGDDDAASTIAEELLAKNPHNDEICNDLGYTWADAGRHLPRCLELIRFAVGQEPRNAAYLDSLGWVHYKLGKLEEARKFVQRSARMIEGQDPVVYDHLGDVEYRLKNIDAARAAWNEALRLTDKARLRAQPQVPPLDQTAETVRAKLAALDAGTPVATAPLGAEIAASQPADEPK